MVALTMESTGLPHPRWRVPILGDVLGVSPHRAIQDSWTMSRRLGPIFERRALGHRFVLVSGADLVAELSDETRSAKHVAPGVEALRGIGGDALFTAYNHEKNWARAHALLTPAFTRSAMRSYHAVMCDVASDLVGHWNRSAGRPVDVVEDMIKVAFETVARAGFGHSFGSFDRASAHPARAAMARSLVHAQRRTLRNVPGLRRIAYGFADRRNAADLAFLHDSIEEIIRARIGSGPAPDTDLLEIMLDAARRDDPNRLDRDNIRYQALTFLLAGHETTAALLAFALHYLSQDPVLYASARAEVDAVWGSGTPEFEQVPKLRLVRRIVDETLRLWPPVPAFAREARTDTVLGGRHSMQAGDWVVVLVLALHRDPVWGDDPDRFDPDRFLPDRIRLRPPHVYKPFGTGARACIGRQFAVHEAVLVLGTILREYDLVPDPGYRLQIHERLSLSPAGLTLTPRPRRPSGPA